MRADHDIAERVRQLLEPQRGRDEDASQDVSQDGGAPRDGGESRDGSAPRRAGSARSGPLSSAFARLAARIPVRLDPGRRAAVAVGFAVLVAALVTGGWMLASRPRALAVSTSVSPIPGSSPAGTSPAGVSPPGTGIAGSSASPALEPSPSASIAPDLVVDVAGKVAHPGLYHLPAGSRVADAVTAAGGARRGVDLTDVNLAAPIADGQQIVVGVPGVPASGGGPVNPAGGSGAAAASSAAVGPVDLNTATLEQLETLPGIGPALGQRILDWRSAHGSFATIDQLNDVSGIGDVKYAALKPLVTV